MRIPESTSEISKRKIKKAFPACLNSDVEIVLDFLHDKNFSVSLTSESKVMIDGESLTIPARVYSDVPDLSLRYGFTKVQYTILLCIYLRHHNGYIRQAALELLKSNSDYFAIPFIFQLLGEYVKEILIVANDIISEDSIPLYLKFKSENPTYWLQTESRIVSYWNEYYRKKDPKFKEYIGYRLLEKMK